MPSYSVKIENLEQIRAAFVKSPAVMTKNISKAIVLSIADIEAAAAPITPVATGLLRSYNERIFMPLEGRFTKLAPYAVFVHEGTRYISARPFLQEALTLEDASIKDRFKKAVQDTLDSISKEAK